MELFSYFNKSLVNAFSFILASAFVLLLTCVVVLCDPEGLTDLYSLCFSLSDVIIVFLSLALGGIVYHAGL